MPAKKQKKQLFGAEKLFYLQLEGSPFAMALWAAGKTREKLIAWSQECVWKGK